MARQTKHELASAKAVNAVSLFRNAHDELAKSVELLDEVETEHRDQAEAHLVAAEEAKADREANEKVRAKLADLIA